MLMQPGAAGGGPGRPSGGVSVGGLGATKQAGLQEFPCKLHTCHSVWQFSNIGDSDS